MYKFLIVDDNKLSRDTIEFIIKSNHMPFEVSQAKNGIDALELIKTSNFDCVITDIKMPRMNGVELVRQAKLNNYSPIFLICSGYQDFADAKAAIEYGVENYILKPIDVMDFLKIMEIIISRIEQNTIKKDDEIEKKLYYYFNSGVIDESEEMSALLSKVTRVIVVKSRGKEIFIKCSEIKKQISSLLNGQGKYVNIDKNTDVILFMPTVDSDMALNNYIFNLKQIYNKFDKSNFFISTSKQVTEPNLLLRVVLETIKSSENKLFQDDTTALFSDKGENLSNTAITSAEHRVYEAINLENFEMAKAVVDEYFNLLHSNAMASTIFIKFQASSFLKAIAQRVNNQFDTVLLEAIENIGGAETILELKRIINNFIDIISKKGPNENSENLAIRNVKKIIETEYEANLTLEYLANKVFLSPAYLSNAFKQQVGANLFSYVATVRMQKGKQLLMTTNKKILEISKQVGYESPSYFNQIFKLHYGMTPKEYRQFNK